MRTLSNFISLLATIALVLTSCKTSDDNDIQFPDLPSAQDFANLRDEALTERTQHFQIDAGDGQVELFSENGVRITLDGSCMTNNGDAVTGTIDVEFVELFDRGDMLATNKATNGIMPNGDKAVLVSGGEFFINATQDGGQLDNPCGIQLVVPTNLTGGPDAEMTLWTGVEDEDGNNDWREAGADGQGGGELFMEGFGGEVAYFAFFQDFGWTNVDRFYNDPRPKTLIKVDVPDGYDQENSAVYLSYDGEGTALARLDVYNVTEELFSEHYGQIPIGLECHVIFATEEDGSWRYAAKSVTIADNDIITIALSETNLATDAQLTAIINGLP